MSKKNQSKRAIEQGAERVQKNNQEEYSTTMSAKDHEKQMKHSEIRTIGGE
ncbi:hypothetical protein [Alkalihalobacillus sp. AL-G]|uniref:hypothetical protein n=1 Tax=Alkalihalobacillus sp. AL-G TaxID=2926399 RepID=UPI00272A1220|nr:hypothetical protein [Alkalihalobacillus sp. AL-G]WLD94881.1 hypothetical protein MOJ78_08365 [Alkalihalobacillus sp. AL-G]